MPSPESSRMNLEHARASGRVKIWRPHSESQRIKAGIVLLHETQPNLSQREIARTFRVSQPYVQQKVLKQVLALGIEKALGPEAYELFRMGLEVKRQEHFQAASRAAERSYHVSIPNPWRDNAAGESSRAFEEPVSDTAPIVPESAIVRDHDPAIVMEKTDETGVRHQFARTPTGELIEVQDSCCNAPARTAHSAPQCPPPLGYIPLAVVLHVDAASRTLSWRGITAFGHGLSVVDQCPSFGGR